MTMVTSLCFISILNTLYNLSLPQNKGGKLHCLSFAHARPQDFNKGSLMPLRITKV